MDADNQSSQVDQNETTTISHESLTAGDVQKSSQSDVDEARNEREADVNEERNVIKEEVLEFPDTKVAVPYEDKYQLDVWANEQVTIFCFYSILVNFY